MPSRSYDYDPRIAPLEVVRSMSGLEFLRRLRDGEIPAATIAATLDFTLTEVEEGRVTFEAAPKDFSLNPIGSIHGGWTATLLDSCMGCAVHSACAPGETYTTLDLQVTIVRSVFPNTGLMRAEGRIVNRGRRVGLSEGRLVGAEDGKLYAHGTSRCVIFA